MKITSLALALALAWVCLVGMTGCKTLEQEMQDNLGLKSLEFQGNSAQDPCVSKQFMSLYNEYQALTNNERVAVQALISSKLDSVIFKDSEVTSQVAGTLSSLLLVERTCSGSSCADIEKGRKQVSDLTTTTGSPPSITRMDHDGRVLRLVTQMKLDSSTRHIYQTYLLPTYDHTDSDEALLAGLRSGEITYVRDESQTQQICGSTVTLKSLAELLE